MNLKVGAIVRFKEEYAAGGFTAHIGDTGTIVNFYKSSTCLDEGFMILIRMDRISPEGKPLYTSCFVRRLQFRREK